MENREQIFQDYYKLDSDTFIKVKKLSEARRESYFTDSFKAELSHYGINAIILRTMLRYNRYFECEKIIDFFATHKVDVSTLKVLDFGCGVGDYGITMARHGANVFFCDFAPLTDFVKFLDEEFRDSEFW